MTDATSAPDARGTVVLLLASSTGGVGQHVRSVARGLVEAGQPVLVCGPAATAEQFDFTATGARFTPVEISANPTPADARAVTALRRALAGTPVRVVHAHGLRAGLVAALARPVAPLVVTWHNAVLAGGCVGGCPGSPNGSSPAPPGSPWAPPPTWCSGPPRWAPPTPGSPRSPPRPCPPRVGVASPYAPSSVSPPGSRWCCPSAGCTRRSATTCSSTPPPGGVPASRRRWW